MRKINVFDLITESLEILSEKILLILLAIIAEGIFVAIIFTIFLISRFTIFLIFSIFSSILLNSDGITIGIQGLYYLETLSFIGFVILLPFVAFLVSGFIQFSINLVEKKDPTLFDLLSQPLGTVFSLSILMALFSLLLLIAKQALLLGFVAVIVTISFSMSVYIVVDQRLDPFEALSKCRQLVSGYEVDLFLYHIIMIFISFICTRFLSIFGIILVLPISWISHVLLYRKLKEFSQP